MDKVSLHRELWGKQFNSPIMLASGTAGFGLELLKMNYLEGVAAVISKAVTPEHRPGNPPPRIAETEFGLLNSIGLANPGVDEIIETVLPQTADLPCELIINVAGRTASDFALVVEKLETSPIPMGYEINVSCPNVKAGGVAFGASPQMVETVTKLVRNVTEKPFSVKLTPNAGDIVQSALAAEEAGADAVTVCNTFLGMKLDWKTATPALARGAGGYTSPALLPMTVARVFQVSEALRIPVLASGGVGKAEDILELMAAGARMVEIGTLLMRKPGVSEELWKEMHRLLEDSSQ